MDATPKQDILAKKRAAHPFRSAVLRGMGIIAPPILTIVIFLWVGNTIQDYVLRPVSNGARSALVWTLKDVRSDQQLPDAKQIGDREVEYNGRYYYQLDTGSYIPLEVYDRVKEGQAGEPLPRTGTEYYERYVELRYMRPYLVIPFFLSIFILVVYLLGKFMAAGFGRVFFNMFEQGIHRVPLVRNVYSSVKQVSDFFFSEREVEYTRVVAVEYPRKGVWSLGFVTGESFLDIRAAANEPVLSVLMATSPMPMTGFTITVKKSETIDLNITVDQAFQFIISCGVVVPPNQLQKIAAPAQEEGGQKLIGSDGASEKDADGSPDKEADRKQTAGSGA